MIIILIRAILHAFDQTPASASDRTRSRGGTTEGGVVERLGTLFSPRSAVQRGL